MAGRIVDKKLRKLYFNRCDPKEPLWPGDERNVDVDATSSEARGRNWVEALANRIELSNDPVCEFFTGLPGSGKSTELRRLAQRLKDVEGAHLLPVLIDAEDMLDTYNPIDVPDILMAILFKTEEEVLNAEGKPKTDALKEGALQRFWHWLMTTEAELKGIEAGADAKAGVSDLAEMSAGVKMMLDLKASPSLRAKVRSKIAEHMTTFVKEVEASIRSLQDRARKRGYAGLVVLFDSLEKLRGISTNWPDVLASAERVFTGGAPYLRIPTHVIYTLPPALVLRLTVSVHFLPMLKLVDRTGKRAQGFDAAREIVRLRVPDDALNEFFGPTSREARVERLIRWTGGYPREIVRLLQTFIAEPSLDETKITRLLSMAGDEYRRTVPDSALRWLARVATEQRLIIDDDNHRETVDLMLQNNVVLRYQNDDPWVDLHPAVRSLKVVEDEIARLAEEEQMKRSASERPPALG